MKSDIFATAAGIAAALALSASTVPVLAAGNHDHGHGGGAHGTPGKAEDVTTTVEVVMHDNYYEPEGLSFKEGETVRFIVRNAGVLVHEFSIATAEMHEAHGPEMQMMVDHGVLEPTRINREAARKMQESMGHGMHEEGNSIMLDPGRAGELIWKFPDHADLEFACNIPGHYDSGMTGRIELTH